MGWLEEKSGKAYCLSAEPKREQRTDLRESGEGDASLQTKGGEGRSHSVLPLRRRLLCFPLLLLLLLQSYLNLRYLTIHIPR